MAIKNSVLNHFLSTFANSCNVLDSRLSGVYLITINNLLNKGSKKSLTRLLFHEQSGLGLFHLHMFSQNK